MKNWQNSNEEERINWIRKQYKLTPNRSWSSTEMKYINRYIKQINNLSLI